MRKRPQPALPHPRPPQRSHPPHLPLGAWLLTSEHGGSVVRVESLRSADLTLSSGAGAGESRGFRQLAPPWFTRSHGNELLFTVLADPPLARFCLPKWGAFSMIDKAYLRAKLRRTRAHAHANCPEAGALLAQHLPLHLFAGRNIICAGYLPIQSEIDSRPAMAVLTGIGAELALPRREGEGGSAQLHFHLCDPFDAAHLEVRDWSLMEPRADQPHTHPNVVLVPLLGFDRQGRRLGYGKGYYDQALANLRQAGALLAIGLAFAAQEVAAIPTQPHDQPLDWIVTEKEAIEIATLGATCG